MSHQSQLNLSILPYLREYIENTETDWNYITPVDFYNDYFSKKSNNYAVIDLRKREDYDLFHMPRSINIFWLELLDNDNLKKLLKYHNDNKKIFLICYVGHTSSQAMTLLKLLGINVTSIKFGYGVSPNPMVPIAGWLQHRYPVVCKDCDPKQDKDCSKRKYPNYVCE
jgi:rhodanese-related sulfurtransferase